ncbi:YD repeat-containing protein [Desulfosudis oleivorans Hxd3]|uniref:YD repeat-containing protein n=2 Tax=Desulfosudis TaxID=2904716 RepID=A9A0K7_DESOH|nr:YD repeat-containing protein [Desulfosudis oleivorans Hxd3]
MHIETSVKWLLVGLFFFALCLVSGTATADVSDTTQEMTYLYTGAKAMPQTMASTGAASTSIPIAVPPGRAGLAPQLSINYNSYAKDGVAGLGWSLAVPFIQRSTKDGLDCSADDFMVNGSDELVPRPGTNTFGAKIEGGFSKYRLWAVNDYWEVTATNGTRYFYGYRDASESANSRLSSAYCNKTVVWYLDYVIDTNGNYMTFDYIIDENTVYIYQIKYTGNANTFDAPKNSVIFGYEIRPDKPHVYPFNDDARMQKRMTAIKVKGNNRAVRKYVLGYDNPETGMYTGRSLLTSVTQYGYDNDGIEHALPAQTFEYYEEQADYRAANEWVSGGPWAQVPYSQPYGFADFNGDNRADFWYVPISGPLEIWVRLANAAGDGFKTASKWATMDNIIGGGDSFWSPTFLMALECKGFADLDRDGKLDLWYLRYATDQEFQCTDGFCLPVYPLNVELVVCLSTGSDFGAPQQWASFTPMPTPLTGSFGFDPESGRRFSNCRGMDDINGDGMQDFWFVTNERKVLVGFSDGSSFGSVTQRTTLPAGSQNNYTGGYLHGFADLNGDGKADLWDIYVSPDTNAYGLYARLSQGETFGPRKRWHDLGYVTWAWTSLLQWWRGFADFNGDGKQDFWYFPSNDGQPVPYGSIRIALSSGDPDVGFVQESTWASYTPTANNRAGFGFADIDGDGKADFFRSDNAENIIKVRQSTGYDFKPLAAWATLPTYIPDCNRHFADFNGDGKLDYWYLYAGVHVGLSRTNPVGLLKEIDNGMGGTFTLDYTPSSAYDNLCLPMVLQTVSSITADDGRGNTYTTSYDYEDGYYDYPDKEFRGFRYSMQTGPDGTFQKTKFIIDDTWLKNRINWAKTWSPLANPDVNDPISDVDYSWEKTFLNTEETCAFVYLWKTRVDTTVGGVSSFTRDLTTYQDTLSSGFFDLSTTVSTCGSDGVNFETITTTKTLENQGGWTWRVAEETLSGNQSGLKRQTTYTYDSNGNLETKTLYNDTGTSPMFSYTYDAYGNLETETDAENNPPTVFEYDATTHTFPTRIIAPSTNGVSHVIEKTYDLRRGKVKTETDENGHTTTYHYDPFGRTERIDAPPNTAGQFGQIAYIYDDDAATRKVISLVKEDANDVWVKDGNGGVGYEGYISDSIYAYAWMDGLGRRIKTKTKGIKLVEGQPTATAVLTDFYYDAYGRQNLVKGPYFNGDEPYPQVQTYYDPDMPQKPVKIETWDSALGAIATNFSYSGLATTITDPDGGKKTDIKDCRGNLIGVVEYNDSGAQYYTTYEYNAVGELTRVEDHLGNVTSIEYNTLGQKTSMNDPDMGEWFYTYTPNGSLDTQTDPMGQAVSFEYDELGRVTDKIYSANGNNVTYAYDTGTNGIGRLYQVSNFVSTLAPYVITTYDAYDQMGNPVQVTQEMAKAGSTPRTYTSGASYDITGRPQEVYYPDGFWVGYDYYANTGLLKEVKGAYDLNPHTYAAYADYDPSGRIKQMGFGNEVYHTYTYDQSSRRLVGFVTEDKNDPQQPIILQHRTYTYSKAGDVTSIADGLLGMTYHYTYDKLHRLTSETVTGNVPSIITQASVMNFDDYASGPAAHGVDTLTLDSMTQTGQEYGYNYDATGNMISAPDFTDPNQPATRSIEYNADGMPVYVGHSAHGATEIAYDGDGARAIKASGIHDIYYVTGSFQVEESSGAAVRTTKYIFAGNARIAMIATVGAADTTRYFHTDHLGSTTVLTDETGQVAYGFGYLPYGLDREPGTNDPTPYKFTGQEQDSETGLYNYNARLYDPAIGLFTRADTIVPNFADPQTLNRYTYCRNNPLVYVDPSGHVFGIDDAIIIAAVVKGAAYGAAINATVAAATGGDIGQAALTGAIQGAIFGGIHCIPGMGEGVNAFSAAKQATVHFMGGMVGGGISAAVTGGDVGQGAVIGGLSAGVGKFAGMKYLDGENWGVQLGGRSLLGGTFGGVAAEMSGGDFGDGFVQGARMAAIAMICNDMNQTMFDSLSKLWWNDGKNNNDPRMNPYARKKPYEGTYEGGIDAIGAIGEAIKPDMEGMAARIQWQLKVSGLEEAINAGPLHPLHWEQTALWGFSGIWLRQDYYLNEPWGHTVSGSH